jgi:hypothetical protein
MASDTEFHIQEQKTSYKDREWTYIQGGRRLALYVEMGVSPDVFWEGVDSAFSAWTEPKGVALDPEEQRIVRGRVETWARERGQPVRFGPGVGIDALIALSLAKGWRPVRGVDSAGHETLRLRSPLRTRLRWLLAQLWR